MAKDNWNTYGSRMAKQKAESVDDIKDIPCTKRYVYDRGDGRKTAFLHYENGMMIYDLCPSLWKGWKLGLQLFGEQRKEG